VSEIDLATHRVLRTFAASSYDPVPAVLRRGLAVLGNARLSGNGTSSCASCHIDGDRDGLAWDLGDPDGDPVPSPDPEIVYSPLKGPMVTQSLRGLRGTGELHWRGDRGSVLDFAEAFMSLMGSDTRPTLEQMADLEEMILALRHPPNPNLGRERVLTNPAQRGLDHYLNGDSYNACIQCHFLPAGTKIPFSPIRESVNQTQNFKPAKLRGIYGKFDRYRKTGFGFGNEGAFGSIVELLARPRAIGAPDLPLHFRHDLSDLLREFDTGTAPVVGTEIVLDAAAAADEEVVARLEFLAEETTRAHCDVIARGLLGAGPRALLYDPSLSSFRLDDRLLGTVPLATLVNEARRGRALLLVQAVPAGSGRRLSIDRDDDLLPDGEEIRRGTSPLTSDTDGDGFRDGWETHEGTDPLDPESIPEEPRRPRILSAPELVSTLPFGELLLRLRVRAEGVLPGARLHAASTLGATLSLGLVLTGRNEWTGFDEIPRETFESGLPGWRFVIENPTGGRSRPLEVK
jgi:hypothetical protein